MIANRSFATSTDDPGLRATTASRSAQLALTVVLILAAACSPAPDSATAGPAQEAQIGLPDSPVTMPAVPVAGRHGDYATTGLRARVAQLIEDVTAEPTSPLTLKARTWTLWEWANAYALDGHPIHPDLSAAVTAIMALPEPVPAPEQDLLPLRAVQIDDWVREFAFREANPAALGTLSTPNQGPFPVDSHQTLTQVYTVGETPLSPGAGLLVTIYAYGTPLPIQTDDPAAAGYVGISSSRPGVVFRTGSMPVSGMHSGSLFGRDVPRPFFEVVEGTLQPGDTVTVHIGDRSAGGPGLRLPSPSSSGHRARLWVRLERDGVIFPMPEIGFPTEGLEAVGVRGFAPSVVAVGEPVAITVRSEDRFRNRATRGAPGYVVLDGETEIARVPPERNVDRITTRFDKPGVHYLTIRSPDGTVAGSVNPILVEEAPALRINWGETHGHSGFAEGIGTVDAYYEFARDDAALDFATLSEHDIWLDDWEWEVLRDATIRFHEPGVFETFLGHEWTRATVAGGHHNVLFRTPEGRRRADSQRAPVLAELYALIEAEHAARDVVVIPHAHQPGNWWHADLRFQPLVEIVSNHGTFEWLGRRYVESGFHLGFIGGSDDHVGHPGLRALNSQVMGSDNQGGLAAVLAPEKSRDAIFDAMKARATYATNGHRIILQASLNGAPMGAQIENVPRRVLSGRVIGTGPIDRISIVKNGTDVRTTDFFEGAELEEARVLELRFWSETDPMKRYEVSRGSRVWQGTLRLEGPGRILAVRMPNTENVYTENARIAEADPRTVEFMVRTRGHFRSVLIEVEGLEESSRIALQSSSPQMEDFAESFGGADLAGSGRTLDRSIGQFHDEVTVRLTRPPTERERTFEFIDEQGAPGDSYWVRAVTTDGGIAWSSPIRVGTPVADPVASR